MQTGVPRLRRIDAAAAAAALLLFASGVAVDLAMQGGLYANAILAGLVAARMAALLMHPAAPVTAGTAPVARTAATPDADLRRLRFMLDQVPAPLLTVSATGVMDAANRAARTLFRTDGRVPDPPEALLAAIAAAAPGQRALLKLAGPAARSYALSVATWSSADGPALLAVLIDIQAELQAAEAAALRELLQTLGHEIMNSLTPVTSLAETAVALLQAEPSPPADVVDALDTIARRARGLDRFVQGYRALARVPPAILRPASVGAVLDEAALLFRTRWRSVALTVQRPSPDILAELDGALLGQALMALLTNAAEAALAWPCRPAAVLLAASLDPPRLRILVADSGAGIDPDRRRQIFQPLFTTKPEGSGIGLGIARQIALSHGGELVLQDGAAGSGAAFCLVI